jgi:hypothetical protein
MGPDSAIVPSGCAGIAPIPRIRSGSLQGYGLTGTKGRDCSVIGVFNHLLQVVQIRSISRTTAS